MRAHRRNLLWILAVALIAFQLGFRPVGIAKSQTLGELAEATFVFDQGIVGIPVKTDEPATESDAGAESAAAESTESSAESAPAQAESEASESTESAVDSESAADASEDAAPMTAEDIEADAFRVLDEAGVWVLEGGVEVEGENQVIVHFAFPQDTQLATAEEQRQQALSVLAYEYGDRAGQPRHKRSEEEADDAEHTLAQLWRFQLRRPALQVKLGLDLQGGTRIVMEAVPSTTFVFIEPSDFGSTAESDAESADAESSAESSAESAPAESAAESSAESSVESGAAESSAESSAESAAAESADETESASAESDAVAEAEDAGASGQGKWEPVAGSLKAHLESLGYDVLKSIGTSSGVSLGVKTVDQPEADAVRAAATEFLRRDHPTITLDDTETDSVFIQHDTIDRVREIMQRRVDMFGLTEPLIQTQGDRRITIEIPGETPEDIADRIDEPADLKLLSVDPERFRLETVPIPASEIDPRYPEKRDRVIVYDAVTGQEVEHIVAISDPSSEIVVRGSDMKDNCNAQPGRAGDWEVHFELKPKAAERFRDHTSRHIKDPLPIVLNDVIESAPVIQSTIGAQGRITGGYSLQEANNLKTLLNAGALPIALEVVENREVSATLGAHNVYQSVIAGVAGLAAVFLFMLIYYRLPGLVADLALTLYCGITLAVLVMFDATLTLTGIAGLILGVGMAVDANVLIFERMKEELRTKSLNMSIHLGFDRAWAAILDGNVTTILAGLVLWMFGTGGVRGFATTLIVSVLASMFTALYVSRVLLEVIASTRLGRTAALFLGARPETMAREESSRGRRPL